MRFLIVTFLCFLMVLGACKKKEVIECESDTINLGTIFLDSISATFIPYTGKEDIYYKNEEGNEIKFEAKESESDGHSFYSPVFFLECGDGEENTYVFRREQFVYFHTCQELNLRHYSLRATVVSEQHLLFVDLVKINFHKIDTGVIIGQTSLNIIASYKGNERILKGNLDKNFAFPEYFEFIPQITFLEKSFSDVYKVENSGEDKISELYYNKEFGIVAFKDLAFNLWVFDRFE